MTSNSNPPNFQFGLGLILPMPREVRDAPFAKIVGREFVEGEGRESLRGLQGNVYWLCEIDEQKRSIHGEDTCGWFAASENEVREWCTKYATTVAAINKG